MFSKAQKQGKGATSSTSNNQILKYGTPQDRMESYVIAFVREFELRLSLSDLILQGEIKKAKEMSPSTTEEICNLIGEVGGAIAGAVPVVSGTGETIKKTAKWLGQNVNAMQHDKKRENYASILWDIIKLHKEDRADLRKVLISVAFPIFRCFEFQFLHVNNNEKWQQGMIHLAKDGVHRSINYYVSHNEATNDIKEKILNGVINGKSKDRPFYEKPELIYDSEFGPIKWSSPTLYEKTGIALEENGSYSYYQRKNQTNKTEKYGYRRLFCTERWVDIKHEYELSQKSGNNRFRDYEYRFETLNDEDMKKILSKINSDYENVTKGDLKEIIEEVKKAMLNDLNSIKLQAKDPDVLEILQQMTNNIDKVNTHQLQESFEKKLNETKERIEMIDKKLDRYIAANSNNRSSESEHIRFNLQAPVQLFTGRKKELNHLHNIVQRNHQRNIVMTVIWGLGGVGKTQLSLEYIDKFAKKIYENIIWIDSENKSHLDDSFQRLAKDELDFKINSYHEEKTKILNKIYEKLSNKNTLVIFDNAEKDEYFQQFLPRGSYPDNNKMHVLLTSQTGEWGLNIEHFHLSEYSLDDGIQLVKKGLNITDTSQDENINKLLYKLQNFPLCIIQAVAYIHDRSYETPEYTVSNYLREFEEIPKKLLDSELFRDLANDPYQKTAYRTWLITTEKIATDVSSGKLALKIFYTMSYLAPQNITIKMFLTLAENDQRKLEKAIRLLTKYSLINTFKADLKTENPESSESRHHNEREKNENIFQIHRTVQDVTRLHIKEKMIQEEVIRNTFQVFQEFNDTNIVDNDKMREGLPHCVAFLKQIKCKVIGHPQEKDMEMYNKLVRILTIGYTALGNPTILKDILEETLEIRKKYYGPDHSMVATILGNLGNAYGSLGDVQKQKELLERALNIHEKHYGPDHYVVATILTNLGVAYGSLGDVKKKKELLERALNIEEKHYGPDHDEVAAILGSLGNAYGSLGDVQKKKDLLERALNIKEKHYGPDHYEVAITLGNLGNAYESLGNVQKQKELLERALNIQEKHYGPDHYMVATILGNLGNAYGSLGDDQKKKELLERALNIEEKHYGPDHYEVAITLGNLGVAYGSLGDHKKEKELLERALNIQEKHFGPDHYGVATILGNLGNAYGSLGDDQKKKDLLERALNIKEKHYGPDHYEVAITLGNLGNIYGELGDIQTKNELLGKASYIKKKH